jgi:hypothetical protein
VALSNAVVWEARSATGSNSNGGGFVAGAAGTDRSQQDAAQVAIDNATITTSITTNVITFTGGYTPTSADVGNLVQMLSGTNVTTGQPYQITAQTATTWTLDRNVVTSGTTTNATGNMGGALGAGALGLLAGWMVASNKAYLKGTTFVQSATSTFAQSVTPAFAVPYTRLIGYGTTREDSGRARLTLQTNTGLTGINATGNGFSAENIDVDCGGLATSTGILITSFSRIIRCKASNFTVRGFLLNSLDNLLHECEATGGTSAATAAVQLTQINQAVGCYIHANACPGMQLSGQRHVAVWNVIVNNTGAASDGIQHSYSALLANNTIHGNGRHGISALTNTPYSLIIRNNLLTANGGYGIVGNPSGAQPASPMYDGNAFWNNTSGARNNMDSTAGIYGVNPYTNARDVILTGDPYVNAAGGNYGLNNTAGAGAAARMAGHPGAFPGLAATTGYLDMGAVQHQDAGGGSTHIATRVFGGM